MTLKGTLAQFGREGVAGIWDLYSEAHVFLTTVYIVMRHVKMCISVNIYCDILKVHTGEVTARWPHFRVIYYHAN